MKQNKLTFQSQNLIVDSIIFKFQDLEVGGVCRFRIGQNNKYIKGLFELFLV